MKCQICGFIHAPDAAHIRTESDVVVVSKVELKKIHETLVHIRACLDAGYLKAADKAASDVAYAVSIMIVPEVKS